APNCHGIVYPTVSGMLTVLAPALMTASSTRQRKSVSERPASSGENSTLSVYRRAHVTAFTACSRTCSGDILSFIFMWIGDVAMNVWIRCDFAGLTASPQRTTSFSFARASPHTVLSLIALAISCTASQSPLDDAGKPASITSTRSRSSWRAMRIFSSLVIDAPGLCSPSRSVVSKMIKWSPMFVSSRVETSDPAGSCSAGTVQRKGGYELSARGAQEQQAAQNERKRGRGTGPEARSGRGE